MKRISQTIQSATAAASAALFVSALALGLAITGLKVALNTTYHFSAVATHGSGEGQGDMPRGKIRTP